MSSQSGEDRARKWQYVIESLIGGLDDAGIVRWIEVHGPDLDNMVVAADRVRDGMTAT